RILSYLDYTPDSLLDIFSIVMLFLELSRAFLRLWHLELQTVCLFLSHLQIRNPGNIKYRLALAWLSYLKVQVKDS
ncbi:MAG: hypothetical protein ACE5IR_12140, partial [bacterium]